jgi:predicted secreted Zn-dependent protease
MLRVQELALRSWLPVLAAALVTLAAYFVLSAEKTAKEELTPSTSLIVVPPIHETDDGIAVPHASVSLSNVENMYDVTGANAAELSQAMQKDGPRNYWAYTNWAISWNHTTEADSTGVCKLKDSLVTMNVKLTLPRWANAPDPDDARRQSWDAMIAALRKHEQGHANNGIRAANAVAASISAVPAQTSCEALDALIDSTSKDIVKAYRKADKDYDRLTNHGDKTIPDLKW